MDIASARCWYHGSPEKLTTIRKGSTITQKLALARIFSHKPSLVSVSDDGHIKHNGAMPGYVYVVAEKVGAGDVAPHPRTSMAPGDEWLTNRELRVQLLHPATPLPEEQLTDADIALLQEHLERN